MEKVRRHIRFMNGSLSFFMHSSEPSVPVGGIDIPEASSAQYMIVMPDGHLQVFEWHLEEWNVINDLMIEQCSYPLACGRNAICSTSQQCSCPGPVNDRQLNRGCSEITPLTFYTRSTFYHTSECHLLRP
ncbi:putative S-locus glycoprotein [Helianthus anomalus]